MDITYLGHASFRIKGKGAVVVTDPYDSDMVGLKFPKISADIVTVSHSHKDHSDLTEISDYKKVVKGPGEYEISGVSIIGISSFHDAIQGQERGKNTLYLIEIDDMRVVHLGDLGHKLTEATIEEIGGVDILMIPTGGVYTIDASLAAEIVREIAPSITIPMHYFVTGINEEEFGKLSGVDEFLKDVGLPVENLDKLSIKKADIQEDKKVVVLERK